jgi:hypothetical protein
MRRVRSGVYRCTLCEDTVFVAGDTPPMASFIDSGQGNTTERVITVKGIEVHRCVYATTGRPQERHAQVRGTSDLTRLEHRRTLVEPAVDSDHVG